MLKFILRRCLEAIPTLFILITISFFMMRLAPGSPFTGERALPPEVLANIEAKYHLNDPIMTQYFSYLKQLAHGDFGPSFKYKDYTVNDLVAASFPVSAKLGAAAFLLAVIIGVSAGVIAALKQNTRWDYTVMGFAMTGVVIPQFCGGAATGDGLCDNLAMAAWRRLERRGVKIYDPADGCAFTGLYCQHRSYYARLND
ncbi:Oligopeptide transport system permease protein oppB [Salmonella enterica subsp. enterica]|nr:Oligopeptide transport system permease protein oppB [Salmonella enterica subsp. enterica]